MQHNFQFNNKKKTTTKILNETQFFDLLNVLNVDQCNSLKWPVWKLNTISNLNELTSVLAPPHHAYV